MITLTPPKYQSIENKILSSNGNQMLLSGIRVELTDYKSKLDFVTNRFLKDYGHRLDVDSKRNAIYIQFIRSKSEEYAKATRMLRLLTYYETLL